MRLKEILVGDITFPLIDIVNRSQVMRYLDFYRRSQWWDLQRLKKLQEKKIRKMISYAYNNVPYYRKILKEKNLRPEDIKNGKDLEKIPVLTHENVRHHLDDLIAVSRSKGSLSRWQTAGTTGHPLILYRDKNELSSVEACLYRGWEWCGYRIGMKIAQIRGAHLITSKYTSLRKKMRGFLTRFVYMDAWNLSEEKIKNSVKKLNDNKPTFLRGYASPIYIFAEFINQKDVNLKFDLTGISTTAEPIFGFQRDTIEKAFNCQVFDQYGSVEVSSMGFECEEHMGLHIPMERIHMEFLDIEDNSPVSDGKMGRIIVTCLENYGMPIIRYDTGDLGIKRRESCSCGRNLPLMDSIVGRTIDLIRLPNGNVIHGLFFKRALEDLEWIAKYGIIQFQVVQKKLDHIVLKIHSEKKPSQKACESFVSLMERHLGDIVFDIEFVEQIPVSASGKRRYIISEVDPQSS